MMRRTALWWVFVAVLAGSTGAGWAASHTQPPLNICLITLDTTRADRLGCSGWKRARTPNLDRLAAQGTRFARCDASAPITLPSHATIMTGLEPPKHRVRDNGRFTLDASLTTLAERLRSAGYETAAVVGAVVLDRRYGLDQGFDHYDDRLGGREERLADEVTDLALERLDAVNGPFFLWAHYYDPHAPYDPPPGFVVGKGRDAAYDGEIAFVDRQLGRLLCRLPPRTVTVVVGDHGEMLGSHGELRHGVLPHREARRVPLLLAGPGIPSGRFVETLVRTTDLFATLLAAVGLEPQSGNGAPLQQLLVGEDGPDRASYCESFLPLYAYGWHPLRAVSDGRWLLVAGARARLFDLGRDPAEVEDVAAKRPRVVRRLVERLEVMVDGWGDHEWPQPRPVDEATRRRLASLGYLGADACSPAGPLPDPYELVDIDAALHRIGDRVAAGGCADVLGDLPKIVARNPTNVPARNMMGACLMGDGRFEDALKQFRAAIRAAPRWAVSRANAAGCLLRLGRRETAEAMYREALELNPGLPEAAANLARLLRLSDRADQALEVTDRATRVAAPHPRVLLEGGLAAAELGRLEEARAHFETAMAVDGDDPALVENAAKVVYALGRHRDAAALYRRLSELTPGRAGPWKTLGAILLYRLNDPVGAGEAFRRALDVETDPAERADLRAMLADLSGGASEGPDAAAGGDGG